ncbi:MAG: carboxypeptidase-like regulatory domain-containing protein [Bryobacteraceae bacterium]
MNCRVVLLLGAFAHAGMAACLISGTVVDVGTGKPLAGAKVLAKPSGKENKAAILRLTDPQGAFCFERLEAGVYNLIAQRAAYMPLVYGGRLGTTSGLDLKVDGVAETPAVTLKMTRSASIAGTVTNASGELLENLRVRLWHRIWDSDEHRWNSDWISQVDSDDRGAFHFGPLVPGVYYLSAEESEDPAGLDEKGQPVPGSGPATYFGGSFKFERATPVSLEPGQDVGIMIAILPRVSGRSLTAHLAPGVEHEDQATLEAWDTKNNNRRISASIGKDGSVSIHNLIPGKYSLHAFATPSIEMVVDLTDGDVDGLVLAPTVWFDVPISIINGPKNSNQFPARAREMATGDVRGSNSAKRDGSYVLRGLKAGVYWLDWNGKEGYLKSLIIDGKARPDTVLDLRNGAPGSVQAVFSANMAQVKGHVVRAADAPARLATTVVWMDEEHSHAEALGDSVKVDPAGQFLLEKMPPGKYRLFAIEGFDEDMWGSPELAAALREKSVAVELRESDEKQAALPLITAEEWDTALRKVGM